MLSLSLLVGYVVGAQGNLHSSLRCSNTFKSQVVLFTFGNTEVGSRSAIVVCSAAVLVEVNFNV